MRVRTGATTEAELPPTDSLPRNTAAPAKARRTGLSVRTRIVVSLALMVAIALTACGTIIYVLESARVNATAAKLANHELAELASFKQKRVYTDAEDLLYSFLDGNVASDGEMLVGWIDGAPQYRSAHEHSELTDDPAFRAAVTDLADTGGSVKLDTSAGEVLITVQTITQVGQDSDLSQAQQPAALVVVSFIDDSREELTSLVRTYAIIALLSLGAITLMARWQAGRLLAPLRSLNDTARQIGSTDLSKRISERGNDDITALTRTVNDMLDRIEGSFTSQRTFLDDAGHELRTPLTVLRTHLELMALTDPEELARTQALLLDEVDRMARLVEDMTLLAQSNRPDFLRPESVDIERLTRETFAKATGLGDRDWQLDDVATGTARLDPQRVTQAVLQLADNAVKHTDPAVEIAIGSAIHNGELRLWVRDAGEGVPLQDRELIFERFGRSVVRAGDEGFGLGLSIVKAIATAHGGRAEVAQAVPTGAEFSLILPVEMPWPDS